VDDLDSSSHRPSTGSVQPIKGTGVANRSAGARERSRTGTILGVSVAIAVAASVGCTTADDEDPQAADDPRELIQAVPLRDRYDLPPLRSRAGDDAGRLARRTQVYQRAESLGVDAETAHTTWASAAEAVASNRRTLPALLAQPLERLEFDGARLSELAEFVAAAGPAHITVVGPRLRADTALTISGHDVVVDFAGAVVEPGSTPPAWTIELRGARDVAVTNAEIAGGSNGILVDRASNVVVEGNDLHDLSENGIVVTGGSAATIRDNRLHGLHRAGIVLHGDVTGSLVERNEIRDLMGHSNWHAGILLTGRSSDVATDPGSFNHYDVVAEPISERRQNPNRNVITGNVVRDGRSSGIYNDGSIANLILENRIQGNAKEGICLDNGATANVVAGNTVTGNGKRWGQPDDVLARDFVLDEGRAPDGSAVVKLPGVSIDNALYNEVYANEVSDNWGGGIKLVRTSFFNLIGANALTDNGLGRSDRVHFFGIELGAAVPDAPTPDLDFVASAGNIVFTNTIRGRHYSGIFVAPASVQNEIIDNDIAGVEAFEVERAS
jgi:parallel beta-helix repeat protein